MPDDRRVEKGWLVSDGRHRNSRRGSSRTRSAYRCAHLFISRDISTTTLLSTTRKIDTLDDKGLIAENTRRELYGLFRIGEVFTESWLATYRRCMGGYCAVCRCIGHAVIRSHARQACYVALVWSAYLERPLSPLAGGNRDTRYTATYGGVL